MPGTDDDADHPRIRFAKHELVKILTALERADGDELNAGMRLLQVEDELADAREQSSRWHRAYCSTLALVDQTAGAEAQVKVKRLDQAIRGWVGKV